MRLIDMFTSQTIAKHSPQAFFPFLNLSSLLLPFIEAFFIDSSKNTARLQKNPFHRYSKKDIRE